MESISAKSRLGLNENLYENVGNKLAWLRIVFGGTGDTWSSSQCELQYILILCSVYGTSTLTHYHKRKFSFQTMRTI